MRPRTTIQSLRCQQRIWMSVMYSIAITGVAIIIGIIIGSCL